MQIKLLSCSSSVFRFTTNSIFVIFYIQIYSYSPVLLSNLWFCSSSISSASPFCVSWNGSKSSSSSDGRGAGLLGCESPPKLCSVSFVNWLLCNPLCSICWAVYDCCAKLKLRSCSSICFCCRYRRFCLSAMLCKKPATKWNQKMSFSTLVFALAYLQNFYTLKQMCKKVVELKNKRRKREYEK